MNILFINSKSPDYIEDQLFSALTDNLGKGSVSAYPKNYLYYLERKPYPLNMGKSRGLADYLIDKLMLKNDLKNFSYDCVVIGSTKRDTFERFLEISDYLPEQIPLIYIDGGDFPEVGGDARRLGFESLYDSVVNKYHFKHIFKREYLIDKKYADNVYPFPMSFKLQPVEFPVEKKYDVSCWCVESDPIRTQALSILENLYDCRSNGTTLGQTFRKYKRKGLGYLRELGSSRISCNFRGVGWDTLRYWEIPAVQSLMVSQKPGIVIPNNFIHGEHVLFCKDDLSDLVDLIDYYLLHDDETKEISASAHTFSMKHHTNIQRAEYFLEIVSSK